MRVLLTIDDWVYDDRDYDMVETDLTKKELNNVIKDFILANPNDSKPDCYEIMEFLKDNNYIQEVEKDNYWIDVTAIKRRLEQ